MSIISNPHDKFFRETFSRIDVVQSFIEEAFPDSIREFINYQTLQIANTSFTDETLSEHFADLVYQTEFKGQNVLITLLYEHKSYVESFPHWQLLRYITNIWHEEQKQKKQPSVVIPIIIYHGYTSWEQASLKSYFKDTRSDLFRFLPEFDYLLFSLNEFSDKQIANFKNTFLKLATMILKHGRDKKEDFLKIESFLIESIKELEQQNQYDYISSVIIYLENTTELTINELIVIFTKVSTIVTNITMTTAEQIRTATTEQITIEYIQALMKKGFDANFIADTFGLPLQKVEDIIQKIKGFSK